MKTFLFIVLCWTAIGLFAGHSTYQAFTQVLTIHQLGGDQ